MFGSMPKGKTSKETIAVDIDIKINSIEASIREIKQLLVGFQATSFRHVNPELLKGTFQSVLTSLQSPLNQISAFLEEVNVGAPNAGARLSPKKPSLKEVVSPSPEHPAVAIEVPTSTTPLDNSSTKSSVEELAAALDGGSIALPKEDLSAALRELEGAESSFETNNESNVSEDLNAALRDLEERSSEPNDSFSLPNDDLSAALRDLEDESELDSLALPTGDLSAALRDLENNSTEEHDSQPTQAAADLSAALQDLADSAPADTSALDSLSLPSDLSLSAALRDLEEQPAEESLSFPTTTDDLSAALKDLQDGSNDLEGESISHQNDDLSAALRDLDFKSDNLPTESENNNFDDLTAALRDLGDKSNGESEELPSIQGLDGLSLPTDDLSAALRGLDSSSPAALSDLLSSLNSGTIGDEFSLPSGEPEFDLSALNAAAARLPNETEEKASVPSFDFPAPSGKRKKQTNMRPIKMKGKGLMGLSFDDPEATLAELANIQSTPDVPEPTAAAPASEEDSLSASLKELPAATPSWLSMFSTPTAEAEPTTPSDKPRRSSRIGRSTPLPTRAAGKLYREHGVREDINKAGLRRVKKGKGIHASGKPVLQMEDVHVIVHPFGDDSNKALFAVFDGHVGKNCAFAAKNLFPSEFLNQLSLTGSQLDATEAFRNTYNVVDRQLAEYEYEGTTATTVYMWQVGETRYVQAANLGDSTAFLCRDGEAIWLTRDHKVSDPDEQERLKQLGPGAWHPGKSRINGLAVSRAMGDFFVKNEGLGLIGDPFISEVYELTPQDSFLIVASDGLWDVISGQGAMNLIVHMDDAQEMAKALIRHALNSPKCNDNITIIVVTL